MASSSTAHNIKRIHDIVYDTFNVNCETQKLYHRSGNFRVTKLLYDEFSC